MWQRCASCVFTLVLATILATSSAGAEPQLQGKKRLLLLGQGPDGHPPGTHEYLQGLEQLSRPFAAVPQLDVQLVHADGDWAEGPELLRSADGVLLYLAEGAKWLSVVEERAKAFEELAARGGGLSVLHWGMGTRTAPPIDRFVRLFGACHGGPDRKYVVLESEVIPHPEHLITRGIAPFTIQDEFYYRLKLGSDPQARIPLLQVRIDGQLELVAWGWERPDGGRSFGYSGAHFHENWRHDAYRRLVLQGVLWTLRVPVPPEVKP